MPTGATGALLHDRAGAARRMVVAAYRKNGYLTKAARSLIEVMRRVAETEFADG